MNDLWDAIAHLPMKIRVTIVLVLVLVPGLAVVNAYLVVERHDTQNAVTLLEQKVSAQQKYIQAQQTAAVVAARLKKQTTQTQCANAIATVKIADGIIWNIKGSLLDLARVSINPKSAVILRARARRFAPFPIPTCDPGKKRATAAAH